MTVKELVEYLNQLNPDAIVVVSKDAEGNGFSPLDAFSYGEYTAESTWSGYQVDFSCIGDEDYQQPGDSVVDSVCLWPVN